MDIAWFIVAKQYVLNDDGTDSIIGILRGVKLPGPPYEIDITLIIKFIQEVSDVGESRVLSINLSHEDGQHCFTANTEMPSVSAESWLNKLPQLAIVMRCEFPRPGMYKYVVSIDSETKAQEWIKIIDEGDG